ncbi:hypothetical protein B0T25DRAFT_470362 [Lasiosphaeria hispida]|uniref:Uncharacterized protein n=1 Tax=Lasiosphaeria hispida TaxID=260671 RepID=A0AAJ0MKW2_9PEZI|nr:hypothetical protein B0T25DRAFT_470362 [Lasiosphaeria hispida]
MVATTPKASNNDPAVGETAKFMADDDMPPLPLTRKNLALLDALHGNPDSDIHTDNSAYLFGSGSDKMKKGRMEKRLFTTASGFQQQTYENGILDRTASHPPRHDNLSAVQEHLAQRRGSTQPSERAHRHYCRGIAKASNEAGVASLVASKLLKEYWDVQYGRRDSRVITRIPQQDFNRGVADPVPDILEGIWTDTLPRSLQSHSLHSDADNSLTFSHFATEFKRTDGSFEQAESYAAYDGAVLVNARDRALAQSRANTRDGTAAAAAIDRADEETAVLTCVTDGKVAEVFAHHLLDGQYHQNLVASASLLAYPNTGRELIRNAQDYARKKTYELAVLLAAGLKGEEEEKRD